MALFNYASKEITIKIVYYGPGLSGKTTNLQYLHSIFDPSKRGKLISLATEADRTLFFDFLPVEIGKISDFSIRFQLYTVPGQVRYNATRKLVLKGADAVVFVADSQYEMREQNLESIGNMRENLIANNVNPDDIPIILQFNKRDLSNIASVDELNRDLNEQGRYEWKEAVAVNGTGVEGTFHRITNLVMKGIAEKHKITILPSEELVEAVVDEKPLPEKVGASVPGFEPSSFESTSPGRNQIVYETAERVNSPMQTVVQGESLRSKERDAREVQVIPKEKLELIINSIQDLSHTFKELKNMLNSVQSEVKDLKKNQKEIHARIKDVTITLNSIKTKRRWFKFL
ncbi:MAG: Rab family GTPase [Thermodesulfovibrionales bacterium]|nr:Rab family GTPase [Thermodesulfovibrionales bacterium]